MLLTFLAIEQGLDIGAIGLLAAVSAVAQMGARLPLGWALGYVTDRFVLFCALTAFTLSMVWALTVPGVVGLGLAQLFLGASRAGFWTASQTHVIRATAAAKGLARANLVASATAMVGPVIAGWVASVDLVLGRWVVLVLGVVAVGMVFALTSFPVFRPSKNPEAGRVSRRPGVRLAGLATFAGGAWNVVSTTYVPVVFKDAGWDEVAIGTVITLATAVSMVATWISGRLGHHRFRVTLAIGSALAGLGIAVLSVASAAPAAAVAGFLLSGAGSGIVMTLGPALGSLSVHPEERGRAIAVTGTYRAFALLVAPLAVTAATLVLPLGVTLLVLGIVTGGPAAVYAAARRIELE